MIWLSGAAVVIGYLLGSIPTAWLVARRVSRGETDIRQAGDGNAGARNVGQIFGRKWGVFVAAADIAKGAVAVLAFNALADLLVPLRADGAGNLPGMLAGVATIVGQIWPVWLRFRGGRGAATAIGVTAAVLPGPALLMMAPTPGDSHHHQEHHPGPGLHLPLIGSDCQDAVWCRLGANLVLPGSLHRGGGGAFLDGAIPQPGSRNPVAENTSAA